MEAETIKNFSHTLSKERLVDEINAHLDNCTTVVTSDTFITNETDDTLSVSLDFVFSILIHQRSLLYLELSSSSGELPIPLIDEKEQDSNVVGGNEMDDEDDEDEFFSVCSGPPSDYEFPPHHLAPSATIHPHELNQHQILPMEFINKVFTHLFHMFERLVEVVIASHSSSMNHTILLPCEGTLLTFLQSLSTFFIHPHVHLSYPIIKHFSGYLELLLLVSVGGGDEDHQFSAGSLLNTSSPSLPPHIASMILSALTSALISIVRTVNKEDQVLEKEDRGEIDISGIIGFCISISLAHLPLLQNPTSSQLSTPSALSTTPNPHHPDGREKLICTVPSIMIPDLQTFVTATKLISICSTIEAVHRPMAAKVVSWILDSIIGSFREAESERSMQDLEDGGSRQTPLSPPPPTTSSMSSHIMLFLRGEVISKLDEAIRLVFLSDYPKISFSSLFEEEGAANYQMRSSTSSTSSNPMRERTSSFGIGGDMGDQRIFFSEDGKKRRKVLIGHLCASLEWCLRLGGKLVLHSKEQAIFHHSENLPLARFMTYISVTVSEFLSLEIEIDDGTNEQSAFPQSLTKKFLSRIITLCRRSVKSSSNRGSKGTFSQSHAYHSSSGGSSSLTSHNRTDFSLKSSLSSGIFSTPLHHSLPPNMSHHHHPGDRSSYFEMISNRSDVSDSLASTNTLDNKMERLSVASSTRKISNHQSHLHVQEIIPGSCQVLYLVILSLPPSSTWIATHFVYSALTDMIQECTHQPAAEATAICISQLTLLLANSVILRERYLPFKYFLNDIFSTFSNPSQFGLSSTSSSYSSGKRKTTRRHSFSQNRPSGKNGKKTRMSEDDMKLGGKNAEEDDRLEEEEEEDEESEESYIEKFQTTFETTLEFLCGIYRSTLNMVRHSDSIRSGPNGVSQFQEDNLGDTSSVNEVGEDRFSNSPFPPSSSGSSWEVAIVLGAAAKGLNVLVKGIFSLLQVYHSEHPIECSMLSCSTHFMPDYTLKTPNSKKFTNTLDLISHVLPVRRIEGKGGERRICYVDDSKRVIVIHKEKEQCQFHTPDHNQSSSLLHQDDILPPVLLDIMSEIVSFAASEVLTMVLSIAHDLHQQALKENRKISGNGVYLGPLLEVVSEIICAYYSTSRLSSSGVYHRFPCLHPISPSAQSLHRSMWLVLVLFQFALPGYESSLLEEESELDTIEGTYVESEDVGNNTALFLSPFRQSQASLSQQFTPNHQGGGEGIPFPFRGDASESNITSGMRVPYFANVPAIWRGEWHNSATRIASHLPPFILRKGGAALGALDNDLSHIPLLRLPPTQQFFEELSSGLPLCSEWKSLDLPYFMYFKAVFTMESIRAVTVGNVGCLLEYLGNTGIRSNQQALKHMRRISDDVFDVFIQRATAWRDEDAVNADEVIVDALNGILSHVVSRYAVVRSSALKYTQKLVRAFPHLCWTKRCLEKLLYLIHIVHVQLGKNKDGMFHHQKVDRNVGTGSLKLDPTNLRRQQRFHHSEGEHEEEEEVDSISISTDQIVLSSTLRSLFSLLILWLIDAAIYVPSQLSTFFASYQKRQIGGDIDIQIAQEVLSGLAVQTPPHLLLVRLCETNYYPELTHAFVITMKLLYKLSIKSRINQSNPYAVVLSSTQPLDDALEGGGTISAIGGVVSNSSSTSSTSSSGSNFVQSFSKQLLYEVSSWDFMTSFSSFHACGAAFHNLSTSYPHSHFLLSSTKPHVHTSNIMAHVDGIIQSLYQVGYSDPHRKVQSIILKKLELITQSDYLNNEKYNPQLKMPNQVINETKANRIRNPFQNYEDDTSIVQMAAAVAILTSSPLFAIKIVDMLLTSPSFLPISNPRKMFVSSSSVLHSLQWMMVEIEEFSTSYSTNPLLSISLNSWLTLLQNTLEIRYSDQRHLLREPEEMVVVDEDDTKEEEDDDKDIGDHQFTPIKRSFGRKRDRCISVKQPSSFSSIYKPPLLPKKGSLFSNVLLKGGIDSHDENEISNLNDDLESHLDDSKSERSKVSNPENNGSLEDEEKDIWESHLLWLSFFTERVKSNPAVVTPVLFDILLSCLDPSMELPHTPHSLSFRYSLLCLSLEVLHNSYLFSPHGPSHRRVFRERIMLSALGWFDCPMICIEPIISKQKAVGVVSTIHRFIHLLESDASWRAMDELDEYELKIAGNHDPNLTESNHIHEQSNHPFEYEDEFVTEEKKSQVITDHQDEKNRDKLRSGEVETKGDEDDLHPHEEEEDFFHDGPPNPSRNNRMENLRKIRFPKPSSFRSSSLSPSFSKSGGEGENNEGSKGHKILSSALALASAAIPKKLIPFSLSSHSTPVPTLSSKNEFPYGGYALPFASIDPSLAPFPESPPPGCGLTLNCIPRWKKVTQLLLVFLSHELDRINAWHFDEHTKNMFRRPGEILCSICNSKLPIYNMSSSPPSSHSYSLSNKNTNSLIHCAWLIRPSLSIFLVRDFFSLVLLPLQVQRK